MADLIPDDMRAAIASYQGQITRADPGASGHAGYVWDPNKKCLVSKGPPQRPNNTQFFQPRSPRRRRAPEPARDARLRELAAAGESAGAIGAALGVCHHTVRKHLRRLGLHADWLALRNRMRGCKRPGTIDLEAFERLVRAGMSGREIAVALGVARQTLSRHARKLGLCEIWREARRRRGRPRSPELMARDQQIRDMALAGAKMAEMMDAFGLARPTLLQHMKRLDLREAWRRAQTEKARRDDRESASQPCRGPVRRTAEPAPAVPTPAPAPDHSPPLSADTVAARRRAAADRGREIVRDRRRFRETPVPTGTPRAALARDDAAALEARTLFPTRRRDPVDVERLLKDGASNAKIGGDVLVGRLRGARIFTLTLEERATCWRGCAHWLSCCGNNDPRAVRLAHGPALMARLEAEIAELIASHDRILTRLHYLGDFWSWDYVAFWRRQLRRHRGLHAFGFTAWPPASAIGAEIAHVREAFPGRFAIRHSGRCGRWGSFTLDLPTAKKRIGDALVCPEQRDAMNGGGRGLHCGNCAACWSTDCAIVFVEH